MTPSAQVIPTMNPVVRPAPARYRGVPLTAGGAILFAALLLSPGPDISQVHDTLWVPAHALHVAGFLLILLGFPAAFASLGRRFDTTSAVLAAIGYVALMTRCALSAGSHLYSMWILPQLAAHPGLRSATRAGSGGLANIYAGHGNLIGAVIGVGYLALAVALWRTGPTLRTIAGLTVLIGIGEMLTNPVVLLLLAVAAMWLGLRLTVRNDVLVPLRSRQTTR